MIGLDVDGSPQGCRAAAGDLRRLAGELRGQGDALAGARGAAASAWQGSAGHLFGERCRQLAGDADDLGSLVESTAAALETLAEGLTGVRADLGWARDLAVAGGVPASAAGLPEDPGGDWTPTQVRAHRRALTIVAGARLREDQLQADWSAALSALTHLAVDTTRPPADLAAGPVAQLDSGVLGELGSRMRPRTLPELVPDLGGLVPDDLASLPPLPLPSVRRLGGLLGRAVEVTDTAGRRVGLPLGPADVIKTTIKESMEQAVDDLEAHPDMPLWQRLLRGSVVGAASGGGAVAGILACTRLRVPAQATTLCGTAGGWLGEKAGEKTLEVADAR